MIITVLFVFFLKSTAISFVSKSKQTQKRFLMKTINIVALQLSVITSAHVNTGSEN